MEETRLCSLDREDPLEKEMATHSSILAGKSHGQRSQAVYSLWGGKESDTTEQQTVSFSVYSFHLFLITFASVRSLLFLSIIVLIFAWNVPLVSPIFLKRSLVLPFLLFSFISVQCSLKKAFLSLLAVLLNSIFSWVYLFPFLHCLLLLFFPRLFAKPPHTITLPFCISFSLGWFWSMAPV